MVEKIKKGEIARKRSEYTREREEIYRIEKHIRRFGRPVGQYDWRTGRSTVTVPEVLDFEANKGATFELAKACRTNCFIHRKRTMLDFRNTKKISSEAILYLVAEIDRCRRLAGVHMLNGTFPKDKRLKRQMRDSGFYDALGIKVDMPDKPKTFPMEYIKVRSGNLADGRLARELRVALLGPLEEQLERDKSKSFFRALTEAMTNVVHHAYPSDWKPDRIKVLDKGWWMIGHINRLAKNLKIMIVDQGIGIPRSLPRTHREVIKDLFHSLGIVEGKDGNMIRAAMELGRSRLEMSHRGKGLNDLKQIIDLCQAGYMRILSKKGEYLYRNKNGRITESVQNFEESLNGTLVEWSIPLEAILPLLSLDDGIEEK